MNLQLIFFTLLLISPTYPIGIAVAAGYVCDIALLTTDQIIVKHGYPFESHSVTTEDGYILTLHRIPKQSGVPVLLVHAFMESSATWVLLGPGRALAYLLHDRGYDVWLANTRGNRYSRQHNSLDPNDIFNTAYWDFSFHELGVFDLPAMIDNIIAKTNHSKIHYVGYSQGTTSFFVMASVRPSYNNKIISAHALAPVVFLDHARSPLLIALSKAETSLVFDILGQRELVPSIDLLKDAVQLACNADVSFQVCRILYSLNFGWGSRHTTTKMVQCIVGHTPAGASKKQLLHYAQIKRYKTFAPYRKFLIPTKSYDLSKVIAPVALYYSLNDLTCEPADVERLYTILPNVFCKYLVKEPTYNHIDFAYAENNTYLVYNILISKIKSFK